MGKGFNILLLLLVIACFSQAEGKSDDVKCHRSTEGKEFWFGFMQGRSMTNNHFVEITVTSQTDTRFSIYIGNSATPYNDPPYRITANIPLQLRIPVTLVEPAVNESALNMGIHLVAESPVNVYAYNHDNSSSDIAVMYPVESLGTEYYAMCYTPHVHTDLFHGRNSEFVIVAPDDNTTVNIIPSANTDGGHAANTLYSVSLNKGQLFQVQSLNGDLTGSFITSDKPVAVYAGSFSTTVPRTASGGWDHLYEQMPPVKTWGREYYTVPLQTRSKDYFRVLAANDNTTVYIGNFRKILTRGENYEFTLNSPTRIYSDKPILIAQYSQASSEDSAPYGDNFMIILSPVSQAKNDVTFVAYSATKIHSWYVNLVAPVSEIGKIELDGKIIPPSSFITYGNGKYACAQLPLPGSGSYRLRDLTPDHGFIAYVYAFGENEGYGYGVGFNLNLVLDLSDGLETMPNLSALGDSIVICQGSTLKLDAGPYFDKYRWSTGMNDTLQDITVSKLGEYKITASTIDGCIQRDSIHVVVSDPKTYIGRDTSGCHPFSITLDGRGDGTFTSYQWNIPGETGQKVTVNSTGQYSVTATDKYGCQAKDDMKLTVYEVPVVAFPESLHFCGPKTGSVVLKITGTDPSLWKTGTWTTDQPDRLTFQSAGIDKTSFTVTDYGYYKINYLLTTVNDCQVTGTIPVGIFPVPSSNIKSEDLEPNKCGKYNQKIIYTGDAGSTASFTWDFGGLALINDADRNTKIVSVPAASYNPFVTLVVEQDGCISDTGRVMIGANPDFSMDTKKPTGCDSAVISFSGKLNVADKNLLFEWNFGDGSPVSHDQAPEHPYSGVGNYDVELKITNLSNGCQVGFTVPDMVKIFPTPVARISTDPGLCYRKIIPVFYPDSIPSSRSYWSFDGASLIGKEYNSISIKADKPVAAITLRVEENGCLSLPVNTTVKRKPDFDFTSTIREGCEPIEAGLKPTFASDPDLDYRWATDTAEVSGDNPVIGYRHPGIFDVTLTATSTETGCSNTLTKKDWIAVHPKPAASFAVDYPVALIRQSNLNFTDQSLLAKTWLWDFGDGGTSVEANPRHNFTKTGKYPVGLIIKSQYGCSDTASMTIEILPFDVYAPNAFRPGSGIQENRVFMPVSLGVSSEKFHLQIFNRWGEMVFVSNTPDHKWDGKIGKGREAPMGNYVWRADYTDIQGFVHHIKGQVLLIR